MSDSSNLSTVVMFATCTFGIKDIDQMVQGFQCTAALQSYLVMRLNVACCAAQAVGDRTLSIKAISA
jgi:hypothetical protein